MSEGHLWKLWKRGSDVPAFLLGAYNGDKVEELVAFWSQSVDQRNRLVDQIEDTIINEVMPGINSVMGEMRDIFRERDALLQAGDLDILQQARIIGATTSGAARYRDILSAVSAGVIIVEEAGEVLESHVLTSLSATNDNSNGGETKHLIMIGDHKQLRPKVESFNLTKVAGNGYDLDISLFERLVRSGLPAASLAVQHRMRPTISQFCRQQTYPALIDHASVSTFPDVKGVSSNVVFIDHNCIEDNQEPPAHLRTHRTNTTKSNQFEADFCVEIVRFLLLQGYHHSQIVVLTPYLGQLFKIIGTMKSRLRDVEAYISEQDLENFEDDARQELESKTARGSSRSVRCSSIDNYQGEESDIVVISLVRCNNRGAIGFLKEEQRVNVLLSRARYGMFIVGSSKTLLQSPAGRETWSGILTMMQDRALLRQGFPTVCTVHLDDAPIELCKPADFSLTRPNGGCQRPCEWRLSCGHTCPQMCHPVDREHRFAEAFCCEPCRRTPPECNRGHACPKLCKEPCGECRFPIGPIHLVCGHVSNSITCHDARSDTALDQYSSRCKERVKMTFPKCGHETETTCGNARSESPKCPERCGKLGECGHPCKNSCFSCDGNHGCKMKCERSLFCGHVCGAACHQDGCPPCEKKCIVQCKHSRCPKPCCNACASCVEMCDWECVHQGKCPLVCGAPCTRQPCNLRCKKLLACGHRCPSVCGEDCPDKKFCVQCCSQQVKDEVVDVICFEAYGEHNLDEDPAIFLPCGHFFGMSTLDGLIRLDDAYAETNDLISLRGKVSDRPFPCPTCRVPIHSVRRYGRIMKYAVLESLERKHITHIRQTLRDLSEGRKKNLGVLRRLRKDIDRSPMRLVGDACRTLGLEGLEPKPNTDCLLRLLTIMSEEFSSRSKDIGDSHYEEAENSFKEGIELADDEKYVRSGAELRLKYASFLLRWIGVKDELRNVITEQLDTVLGLAGQFPDMVERARDLKKILSPISAAEMRQVLDAMGRTGYNYGTAANEHWYECPNGHPYFIGECSMAMQTSTCPECGEKVGGASHQLLGTNRLWRRINNV